MVNNLKTQEEKQKKAQEIFSYLRQKDFPKRGVTALQ